MTRVNEKVVFIAGAGHSGSTLLGMILGSHPDVFYAGEAKKTRYLGDSRKPERKRVCKICGETCPVWGGFVPSPEPDIYEQLSRRTGRPIVVDSTKNVGWLEARTAELRSVGASAVLIFLGRDGRAVVNSRVRKYPDRDPLAHIEAWRQQVRGTDAFFDAFGGQKARIRYEELATDPETVLRSLVDELGLPFDSRMLRFQESEQHPLGGNNGTQYQVASARRVQRPFVKLTDRTRPYYAEHPQGIRLDLRWERELPARVLDLFESLAGRDNEAFRWSNDR